MCMSEYDKHTDINFELRAAVGPAYWAENFSTKSTACSCTLMICKIVLFYEY